MSLQLWSTISLRFSVSPRWAKTLVPWPRSNHPAQSDSSVQPWRGRGIVCANKAHLIELEHSHLRPEFISVPFAHLINLSAVLSLHKLCMLDNSRAAYSLVPLTDTPWHWSSFAHISHGSTILYCATSRLTIVCVLEPISATQIHGLSCLHELTCLH